MESTSGTSSTSGATGSSGPEPSGSSTLWLDETTGSSTSGEGSSGEGSSGMAPEKQPVEGLYAQCMDSNDCEPNHCLSFLDEAQQWFDGFCTKLCESDKDCGQEEGSSCLPMDDKGTNVCVITCVQKNTCPGGMVCMMAAGLGKICL